MGFPRRSNASPALYEASGEVGGGNGNGNGKMSSYEQTREERIRQNMERMKQLGIPDLSLKLKSLSKKPAPRSTPSARRSPKQFTARPPPGPRRRSSRLQNSTPVDYAEVALKKKDDSGEEVLLREDGYRPEFYNEEHLKLLGSTERSWTLFVDGYDKDGKRIYDPVDGKTCHQCRQKTLGLRTNCCKCNKVQGQFCGDCLYMRYGEHVVEANQNPDWICPACRGICNCSLCRIAKGWAPTGTLYKKATSLGFKSVAHYIIQTRQKNSDSDATPGSKVPTSAKRSLPFSDTDEKPHSVDADYASYIAETMQPADATDGNPGFSGVNGNEPESDDCSNVTLEDNSEVKSLVVQKLDENDDVRTWLASKAAAAESSPGSEGAKYESQDVEQQEPSNVEATLSSCLNDATSEVTPAAAAEDEQQEPIYIEATLNNCLNGATLEVTPAAAAADAVLLPVDVEATLNNCLDDGTSEVKPAAAADVVLSPSSVIATPIAATDGYTRKLRPEAPTVMDTEPAVAVSMTSAKPSRKRAHVSEPFPNSIAARLRERRTAAKARRGDL